MHSDNSLIKKPEEVQKPDLPPVEVAQPAPRDNDEPPQIKGPVEVPDRKKEEVVQLDRPDAGKKTCTKIVTTGSWAVSN